ncbi:hypothetical protein DF185_09315 [Marinifilum breve]|uniref:DUF3324 domain-containing protein n=1 Tax=Marinifilum breve TaxID=2184082 RepID=A0A2V3ZZA0_9BACT|nr:hypothetical protein [Marinifilum breve]PXY01656.1 hypothetical protein DF185_09315 [Marinifilum breve]
MLRSIFIFILLLVFCNGLFANISVVNGLSHTHKVNGGETLRGTIELINQGTKTENLKIYLNDYRYNEMGESFFEVGGNKRTNLSWIELGTEEISLEAGKSFVLPYEVRVPKNLEFNGSYWSVVMIEPVDLLEDPMDLEMAVGVKSKIRYAVQIICNKGDDAQAKIDFKNAELHKGERRLLFVDLLNTGELYHKIQVLVEFYNPETGEQTAIVGSVMQSLHPDNCKRFAVDVSSVPKGDYQAVLLAKCEDGNIFGMHADIGVK